MTPYYHEGGITIYHGDVRDILPTLPDASVDLVLTDPPYPAEYAWVWPILAQQSARLLADRRALLTLLGHYQLPMVLDAFAETPLRYWWLCGMHQTIRTTIYGRRVSVLFKPALWFVKGLWRQDTGLPFDLVRTTPPDKQDHPWTQPIGWFIHYLDRLSLPGEVILDPFMGTGTTLAAAQWLGRRAIGIDCDARCCALAERRLAQRCLPFTPIEVDDAPLLAHLDA